MNTALFFPGIFALIIGVLLEVGARISKSKVWWRARFMVVLGIALVIIGVLDP